MSHPCHQTLPDKESSWHQTLQDKGSRSSDHPPATVHLYNPGSIAEGPFDDVKVLMKKSNLELGSAIAVTDVQNSLPSIGWVLNAWQYSDRSLERTTLTEVSDTSM